MAAAASATVAIWPQGTQGAQGAQGHSAGPAEISGSSTYEAAAVAPRLIVTDQLALPVTEVANQPSSAILVQHAYQLRLAETRDAAATQPSQTATARPSQTAPAASGSPQQIAEAMLGSFGWSSSQFSCLEPLWAHESGWSVSAYNAGSGAFGIPQALPGSRMASAGPDWQTDAATQIKWGLEYIKGTYGSPCGAWTHEEATGWY